MEEVRRGLCKKWDMGISDSLMTSITIILS